MPEPAKNLHFINRIQNRSVSSNTETFCWPNTLKNMMAAGAVGAGENVGHWLLFKKSAESAKFLCLLLSRFLVIFESANLRGVRNHSVLVSQK